jgi:hypothetical protein
MPKSHMSRCQAPSHDQNARVQGQALDTALLATSGRPPVQGQALGMAVLATSTSVDA